MTTRVKILMVLFFFLPAAYSYPGRAYNFLTRMNDSEAISGPHALLVPSILLALTLFIVRSREQRVASQHNMWRIFIALAIFMWFLAATISCVINMATPSVPLGYVAIYVAAILIYWALRDMPMSQRDFDRIFMALSIGSLFPLLLGLRAYYSAFGIPDLDTLLWSRYDLKRLVGYQQMTFGNTANTAGFLVLVGPLFLALALDQNRERRLRFWYSICFVLCAMNLLIVQARIGFLVVLFLIPIFLYFKKPSKLALALIAVMFVITLNQSRSALESPAVTKYVKNLQTGITVDAKHDASVRSRMASIEEGWSTFLEHWASGVGPGASPLYNRFQEAHQLYVQQAMELGVLGLIAIVLLSMAVFGYTTAIVLAGPLPPGNMQRFILIVGPAAYLLYGAIGHVLMAIGPVNTWVSLMAALLSLVEFRPVEATSKSETARLSPSPSRLAAPSAHPSHHTV